MGYVCLCVRTCVNSNRLDLHGLTYPAKNGKRALVTGITGQDGSYLAELLLAKGYEVYGMVRRSSSFNTGRIDHIYQDPHEPDVRLRLVYADLADGSSLNQLVKTIRPDEIYNLGAQSHVRVSFDIPEYTSDITGLGCIRLLEAIRETELKCRFYQASSSEMYGKAVETPQTERTPFYPRNPYGCAKAFAFYATRNYREAYGMFAVNGIMFNHESPRRGETFVTRKITRGVARIAAGLQECLVPGQPGRAARLGLCRRLCRGDVADDAGRRAGRLRDRHGRDAFGARVLRAGVRAGGHAD